MRYCLIIFSVIIIYLQALGQTEDDGFYLDEVSISANMTTLKDENTEDRFGFGVSIGYSFMNQKKINVIFGLEYNRTNQFKKRMHEGRFAYATDLTYNINNLSIPLDMRFNIGNNTKIFMTVGAFLDLIVAAKRKGTMYTSYPDSNLNFIYKEFEINRYVGLSRFNYGFAFGLGMRIPIKRYELIIKTDYKWGLHNLDSYYDNIFNRYIRFIIGLKMAN